MWAILITEGGILDLFYVNLGTYSIHKLLCALGT